MVFLGYRFHVLGYLGLVDHLAEVVLVDLRLHRYKVDHALKGFFLADRQLYGDGVGVQTRLHHVENVEEVRAVDVHLVDVSDTRYAVLVRLTPNGLGLRLDAALGAEHRDRAVEDFERTLDLDREVDVSGGIDDIDTRKRIFRSGLPLRRSRRRGDRYTALLLLHHPVHGRAAVVGLAYLVHLARIEQYALRGSRFARVDMRHDTDVTRVYQFKFSCHVPCL